MTSSPHAPQAAPAARWSDYVSMARFVMRRLDGRSWKLPGVLLLALAELACVISFPLVNAGIINALVFLNADRFRQLLLAGGALLLLQTAIVFTRGYVYLRIDEGIGNRLRALLFRRVSESPLAFFERHWIGDIIARVTSDTAVLRGFVTGVVLQLALDLVFLVAVTTILLQMNRRLAALALLAAPLPLLYTRRAHPRLQAASLQLREKVALITGAVQTWAGKPRVSKVLGLDAVAVARFGTRNDQYTREAIGLGLIGARLGAVNTTLIGIPGLLILGYGGYLTIRGTLSIGELFAFTAYAGQLTVPVQRFVGMLTQLPGQYAAFLRIAEFAPPEAPAPPRRDGSPIAPGTPRELRVSDATWLAVAGSLRIVVPRFLAGRGEVVGVIGPNGCGKSTFLRALMGLEDPEGSAGELVFDDGASLAIRAELTSALPQSSAVFEGSVLENISLFCSQPDAARAQWAAERAGLDAWVRALPAGLSTTIGGTASDALSTGQLQRLALSRVLYSDRSVWVMDEPESNLDADGLERLLQMLAERRSERITVLVAHDDRLLRLCDRLYRLEPRPEAGVLLTECEGRAVTLAATLPTDTSRRTA